LAANAVERLEVRPRVPPVAASPDTAPLPLPPPPLEQPAAGPAGDGASATPDTAAAPGDPPGRSPTLIGRYRETADSLRRAMHDELDLVGFGGSLRPERLARGTDVRAAAHALAAARNILRNYRRDLRLIEQSYLDTLTGFRPAQLSGTTAAAWDARPVRAEAYDVSTVADSMVQTMDSLVTFLRQRPGRYRLSAGQLVFTDTEDSARYAHFRERLRALAALAAVRAPAGGEPPATIAELLRASE
jgi:hypothetical protein